MQKLLVYGATGAQGYPVARQLIEAGYEIRLLLRAGEAAEDLVAMGAGPVLGEMADKASLVHASTGMDGVFLLVPFFDPKPEFGINAIDAAVKAGV